MHRGPLASVAATSHFLWPRKHHTNSTFDSDTIQLEDINISVVSNIASAIMLPHLNEKATRVMCRLQWPQNSSDLLLMSGTNREPEVIS